MTVHIRPLTLEDEGAFYVAAKEFEGEPEFVFLPHRDKMTPYKEVLQSIADQEAGINMPENFVPSSYLFGFVGNKLVGRVMVRHYLNESLSEVGGHIGYGVVRSARGRGYGSKLLEAGLVLAAKYGVKIALLTCFENNLHSRRIIEKHGGILQKKTILDSKPFLHYHITIGQ